MTSDRVASDGDGLTIYTIGAFGYDEETFFHALVEAGIDTLCDIRQRRGVRGARYAFVNSSRLQHKLARLNVRYVHVRSLAPTTEVRRAQKEADEAAGVDKRRREVLHPAFVDAYRRECLDTTAASDVLASLLTDSRRVALFCVEQQPAACHRSLAAEWLSDHTSSRVEHLVP